MNFLVNFNYFIVIFEFQSGGSESADSGVHPSSASGSPREEDANKGNSPRPHSNMSPIHETAVDAANGHHMNPPESDEVFITPTESEVVKYCRFSLDLT